MWGLIAEKHIKNKGILAPLLKHIIHQEKEFGGLFFGFDFGFGFLFV